MWRGCEFYPLKIYIKCAPKNNASLDLRIDQTNIYITEKISINTENS